MLLLIDIGNTHTTIGVYENNTLNTFPGIETVKKDNGSAAYSAAVNNHFQEYNVEKPEGVVICSVVPWAADIISAIVKDRFNIEAINVNHKIKTGLTYSIRDVETLGADRIANAVAASKLYKVDVIIIDFGTATTICFISEQGEYKGGAIMPGLGMSAEALSEKTAKLPKIDLRLPAKLLEESTAGNINTGIVLGHAGAVDRITGEIAAEIQKKPVIIATGGYAELITPHIKVDQTNPLLTLEGLRFIYELNA
jgi:type III pantothenate kinase